MSKEPNKNAEKQENYVDFDMREWTPEDIADALADMQEKEEMKKLQDEGWEVVGSFTYGDEEAENEVIEKLINSIE